MSSSRAGAVDLRNQVHDHGHEPWGAVTTDVLPLVLVGAEDMEMNMFKSSGVTMGDAPASGRGESASLHAHATGSHAL